MLDFQMHGACEIRNEEVVLLLVKWLKSLVPKVGRVRDILFSIMTILL